MYISEIILKWYKMPRKPKRSKSILCFNEELRENCQDYKD